MSTFINSILKTKTVSVWGIGYLGYTSILRLQSKGFSSCLYDFNEYRLTELLEKKYPGKIQHETWTKNGKIPEMDLSKVKTVNQLSDMFGSKIHIISFPFITSKKNDHVGRLIEIFNANKEKLKDSLIIFQSNETPDAIRFFLDHLKFDAQVASAFRNDWNIEDFFSNQDLRPVSGNSNGAIRNVSEFFDIFDIRYKILDSIEEAEVYENSQNALHSIIPAFFNQLSLAYPHLDIKKISELLIQNIDLSESELGFNAINYKISNAVDNLLNNAPKPNYLSMMNETQNSNVSLILYYADLLKKRKISSVTIYGLSTQISLKDIKISPSIALAEYLNKIGVKVYVNDPNFTNEEILEILPFVSVVSINEALMSDALFIMNGYIDYKFLNQDDLEKLGIGKMKVIIDSLGLFKEFEFSTETLYHQIGDGNLSRLEQ